jgi:signal transduction histidine kinase
MRMEGFPDEALAQRCIADIREMNQLIDTSMEVFRGGESSEPTQATDVFALVQSITDDLIEQGQPVSFEGDPSVVRAKPLALSRVVVNLITNAVRYGQAARVKVSKAGQQVVITVEDDGPGLPPKELDAVFEPYYRVEQSRNRDTGGAGLGLYIARDLIVKQGGVLRLANRPEGGLRAEVRLPL